MERNKFLEMGGLAHKTDTHEWYNDTIGTIQAQREDRNFVRLLHITCFVVRNIKTGEYDRVVMDTKKRQIIFDTKSAEELHYFIAKLKLTQGYAN